MANEIIFSSIGDLTTSETLSTTILMLLADRNALPAHPVFSAGYAGSITGSGSNVKKVAEVGLMGYDLLSTVTDGSAVSNTALTDGSVTVTVVRKSKVYQPSDLARLVDATGMININAFAQDAVVSLSATLASMVANVMDDYTTVVGTSGADLTFSDYLDAVTTLEIAKVQGPYFSMLAPIQYGDVRKDVATASGGAVQFSAAGQGLLSGMVGIGLKNSLIDGVALFTSAHVPTSGGNYLGGMCGAGGLVWADGVVPYDGDPNAIQLADGKILFERDRTATYGLTGYVSHAYLGVSKGIDTAGVTLRSSST